MMQDRMVLIGTGRKEPVPVEMFGNKAAMLARIASLSIRIPPAFCLGVSVCEDYFSQNRELPTDLPILLRKGIDYLEGATGNRFDDPRAPLLVSVRSGAPISMPGMMSTILNVGLTRIGVEGLIARSGNPRFGWDCYRRLIASYSEGVFPQGRQIYNKILMDRITSLGLVDETELDSYTLRSLAGEYEDTYGRLRGEPFPQEPFEQLTNAVIAVLDSWASPRADNFRKMKMVNGARGTAVTVQTMVFGNMGFLSGSGVAFTRNPWTGTDETLVDFRFGVQGEDVVSGEKEVDQEPLFRKKLPMVEKELLRAGKELENNIQDMQDIEFTVQEGELYLLQTRNGKRSPLSALRIAVDLSKEGIITPAMAVERLNGIDISAIWEQKVVTEGAPLAKGIPASVGIVTGEIALSMARVMERKDQGPVILVKESLTPDDLPGVVGSSGSLTCHGNRMAHAVVVARQLGKGCIVNVTDMAINPGHNSLLLGGRELHEGDIVSMDSLSGLIYEGAVEVVQERPKDLIDWVEHAKLEISSLTRGKQI